jgi:uncharacterized protein (DUF885 family)
MRTRLSIAIALCLLGFSPEAARSQTAPSVGSTHRSDAASRLRRFLADDWKYWMREYPEYATQVGYPGQNGRWTDNSSAAIDRRNHHLRESLETLQAIPRADLPGEEQLNYDLYRKLLESAIEGLRFHDDALPFAAVIPHNLYSPVSQIGGVQQDVPRVIALMPTERASDYQDIVSRLEAVAALVDQTISLMQEGLRHGWTPPKITLRDVQRQVESEIVADPMASPMLSAFQRFPAAIPKAEQERLTRQAVSAYTGKVVPAFRKLRDFLVQTYIAACRETIAASSLPDGAAAYSYLVRWHTTSDLTPQQIHEIGLAEVKRIRAEMNQVIEETGFKGSFAEFTNFLRSDPRFYFVNADDLVEYYRDICKRADPQLAYLFGTLPRLPYGVSPVPAAAAPSQTTAYYQPGSVAAGRPGWYSVNTYDLPGRPKWEMEALTMHEAVPGHHLQLSLAQELKDVPEFRKYLGYTSFVEGWALYAESLGRNMSFYTDPYSKFGQLTYAMWRAIRLVVDTGMHTMGWSREQAIRYFEENTGKSGHDIVVEVDRYIVWPGQALGYKIGELKIQELRAYAERELGPQFNIRAFHDAVLDEGAVPLDLLDGRIKAWVAKEKRKRKVGCSTLRKKPEGSARKLNSPLRSLAK